MRIVFALLAHNAPEVVGYLARTMIKAGHRMVIHYDGKVPDAQNEALVRGFEGEDAVRFARRVTVGWGEWSIVQATLNCLDTIAEAGWEPDYVYLMSGMDFPIRSSAELETFLERNKGDEFIESVPSDTVKWVKSGPQRERYQYRWYLNWRERPQLTDHMFNLQRRLGLRRAFVRGMAPHLGSQWWVLTWETLLQIRRLALEPDIQAFFRTTLVPDELFFQTLVRQFVPDHRIIGCPLTLYQFTDYGYPVVYHADHLNYLTRQRFFMARKLSSHAMELRHLLEPFWTGDKPAKAFEDEEVGIRGTEYEDWRLAHREGAPGCPLVGAAGLGWTEAPRRTAKPHVVVMGNSTEELRFVHRILARNADLRVHGQLFHPAEIEFADGDATFASYAREDIVLRDVSTVEFLSDVVRAEPNRTTVFLLRWEQGGAIAETLMKRPNTRMIVMTGDPLVAFSENAAGPQPKLDRPFQAGELESIQPDTVANRFRVFLKDFRRHLEWVDWLVGSAKGVRPKGWLGRFDVVHVGPEWLKRLEACVGVKLAILPEEFEAEKTKAEEAYRERVRVTTDLLIRGGIDPVVFDVLRKESGNPALALALV